MRLHDSHASSPENLTEIVQLYPREGGRRPVEKARAAPATGCMWIIWRIGRSDGLRVGGKHGPQAGRL